MQKHTLPTDLLRHGREFQRALASHAYEQTDEGVLFSAQKVLVTGAYTHDVNGVDERVDHNLVTAQGLSYLLATGLGGSAQEAGWFLTLFSGNVTPQAGWTAASFATAATEVTSTSNGFSEASRPAFVPAAPANGAISNAASKAAFSIVTTGSPLLVYGGALISSNARGGTAGILMSASRFSTVRSLENGDQFNLGYTLTLQSA